MSAATGTDRDAMVHEVGASIVRNPRVSAQPWDSYALIARVDDDRIQLNGFAYAGDAPRPATPQGPEVSDRLKSLREAMREPGKPAWGACVVRIVRATQKINIEFEYDHPERWDVTPQNAQRLAQQAAVRA